MAVRFDAAADRLLRTTDLLGYNSAYTWMAWVYLVSDLDTISTFWCLDANSALTNIDSLRTSGSGTNLRLLSNDAGTGVNVDGTGLSVGVWYHLAMVRESATSLKLYLNGVLDITNTKDITGRTAATRMEHGAFRTADSNRSDSRMAYIKAWSTNLAQAEIQNEINVIPARRRADLYGDWWTFPGATERLRDYSGNGRDWTAGGTLTDEDPPPVSVGRQVRLIPFATAAAGKERLFKGMFRGMFRGIR